MPKDLLFKYAGQYFCTVEESVSRLLSEWCPSQVGKLYEREGSVQALPLLLQPALGPSLLVILLIRLKVFQRVLLLLISLLNQLAFQGGGALFSHFPIPRQPLGRGLVVGSLMFAECVRGLLSLQPGVGVLRTVAVCMGESAQAAIF